MLTLWIVTTVIGTATLGIPFLSMMDRSRS